MPATGTTAEGAGFNDKLIYEEIMLDPPKRKISFLRLTEKGGKEVFRQWTRTGKQNSLLILWYSGKRLSREFFIRDVLDVAPELIR